MVPCAHLRVHRRARMTWLGLEVWMVLVVMGVAVVVAIVLTRRN
jgi:hypothetical protein